MIDDATIKKITKECGGRRQFTVTDAPSRWMWFTDESLTAFAKACYAAGQDAQREEDEEKLKVIMGG